MNFVLFLRKKPHLTYYIFDIRLLNESTLIKTKCHGAKVNGFIVNNVNNKNGKMNLEIVTMPL